MIAADVSVDQPFMILERLAGTDIGNVLDTMSQDQIRSAAHAVAEMQRLTSALPLADGFGYALNYQSPLHRTWRDVLEASVDKSRQWIRSVGVVDEQRVAQVAALLDHRAGLVVDVQPRAFLHDAFRVEDARDRVALYTALHCLAFLGELGQAFNRDEPAPIDRAHQAHLEAVLCSLL